MPKIIKSAKGSFTVATVSIDGSGRVFAASSGTAGGNNMIRTTEYTQPGDSGTFTAATDTTKVMAIAVAGGGGGAYQGPGSQTGGNGAVGIIFTPVTNPYTATYTVGEAGARSDANNSPGSDATASTFGTLSVAGGEGGQDNGNTMGRPGTATNSTITTGIWANTGNPAHTPVVSQAKQLQACGFTHDYTYMFTGTPTQTWTADKTPLIKRRYFGIGGTSGGAHPPSTPGMLGGSGQVVVWEDLV